MKGGRDGENNYQNFCAWSLASGIKKKKKKKKKEEISLKNQKFV